MKKLWKALPFLLLVAAARADVYSINQFGSYNSDDDPLSLTNGDSPDESNIVTDDGPGLTGRRGFTAKSTETVTGQCWVLPHSSGTRYKICQCSGNLKASLDGISYTILVSTVDATKFTAGAVLGDQFYFSDVTNGIKYATFSGSVVALSTTTSSYNPSMLASWKNRIWAAGISGSERIVIASEYGVGYNFTLPTTDNPPVTEPTAITISGALDEPISVLYSSYQDKLVIMKAHSFGLMFGSSRANFAYKKYSDQIGTSYPESIQDCDGYLRWLGPARTIWEFDGATFHDITNDPANGKRISSFMASISQGDGQARQYGWDTKEGWANGDLLAITTTIIDGSILLSTAPITNITSTSNWTSFGLVNATFTKNATYDVIFKATGTSFPRGGIYVPWNHQQATSVQLEFDPKLGATTGATDARFTMFLSTGIPTSVDTNGYPLGTAYYGLNVQPTFGSIILIENPPSPGAYAEIFITSGPVLASGGPPYAGGTHGTIVFYQNDVGSIKAYADDGYNHYLEFVASYTATDLSSFNYFGLSCSLTGIDSTGTYMGYGPGFVFNGFSYKSTTGTWVSNSIPTTSMSSFGNYGINGSLNGGAITTAIYTDSDSAKTINNGTVVAGTYISSQTVTDGAIPTLSTAAYVFTTARFTVDDSTSAPQADDITIKWNTGNLLKVASAWSNKRYWLSTAKNSTYNNSILVYDKNKKWHPWDGIDASSMFMDTELYFTNSTGVFQAETGYNDNGASITSYYRTPTYALAGPDIYAMYQGLYMTTANSASTLETTYRVNGITSDYSLGSWPMNTQSGYQSFKMPFSIDEKHKSKYINFKWSITGTAYWRILNGNVYYIKDLMPE